MPGQPVYRKLTHILYCTVAWNIVHTLFFTMDHLMFLDYRNLISLPTSAHVEVVFLEKPHNAHSHHLFPEGIKHCLWYIPTVVNSLSNLGLDLLG
jgi:hypothetical protein